MSALTRVNDRQFIRKPWRERIRHFTPAWHTINMGTGVITLLFHSFPYGQGSSVLQYIALGLEFFNLILFFIFIMGTISRYLLFRNVWVMMIHHPVQSLYLGSLPMGFATIISAAIEIIYEQFNFGGKAFIYTMWTLWWMTVMVAFAVFFGQLHIMFTRHTHSMTSMTTVWLLPIVTPIVISSTAGIIALSLMDINRNHALLTFCISLVLVLVGLIWSFMVLTIYFNRLVIYGLPEGPTIFSAYLPLGPMGQAGYSLLIAGENARNLLPLMSISQLPFSDEKAPAVVEVVCVCFSFLLWSLATAWLILATIALVESIRKMGTVPFKVTFWGMIFPNGVYANLTIQLATIFNSPFFRVWGAVYAVFTLLLWLFAMARTVPGIYDGSAFQSPCIEEAEADGWSMQHDHPPHYEKKLPSSV